MPYDEDQIENLEDELDALSSPTTHDVLFKSQDYDAGIVAASAARRAMEGGGGGAPSGPAGGVLGGTYPNPSFAADMATQAELDAAVAAAQPVDPDLTAIAALSPSNDDLMQRKAGAWTNRTVAQLLSDLGIAAAYQPLDSDLTAIAALTTTSYGRALLGLADAAALRTAAGLVIGTDVQAFDSDLAAFAGLSIAADKLPYGTGSHTLGLADLTAFARTLLDDADAAAFLATLKPPGYEVAYAEVTSDVAVTSTSEPGDTIVSLGAVTYTNVPHIFEFSFAAMTVVSNPAIVITLCDGATPVYRLFQQNVSSSSVYPGTTARFKYTPSAGSHTFLVAGTRSGGTSFTLEADNSTGAAKFPPIQLRAVIA